MSTIISSVNWKKVVGDLANQAVKQTVEGGARNLIGRLKDTDHEKTAREITTLFLDQFIPELESKLDLSSALPGYQDQLKHLIEHAAPDILANLRPNIKEVDLGPVQRMWSYLRLDPLPQGFDWNLVATTFGRSLNTYVRRNPELREQLKVVIAEEQRDLQSQSAESLARIAGPDPGFDLSGYRAYLRGKCELLHLSVLHTSTYHQRIQLWNIFVPQFVRASVPVRHLPKDLLRKLREERHIGAESDNDELERLRQTSERTPPEPILEALARERLSVVLGDPGSGKTSLLKFRLITWVEVPDSSLLPLWIELKHYARDQRGLLKYLESGKEPFSLDAHKIEEHLRNGTAVLYLDGLDEIFDGPQRDSVTQEIIAYSARYPALRMVVSSRIIGYHPDPLRNAGFTHLTLEDFDDRQIEEFLRRWHIAAENEVEERARLSVQLSTALKESRAVRELAGNPLLLTMIAVLNKTQPLPRDRVELYAQATRVLLQEWDSSRALPADQFARQEKEALLRELAGVMQKGVGGLAGNLVERDVLVRAFRDYLRDNVIADSHAVATRLVDQLVERNFILCYAGANRYSFVHRTFLEYFCAAWFVEQFEKRQIMTLDQLQDEVYGKHWKDPSWHEVLRLIAGMVGEKQAEKLVRFLLNEDGRNEKLANLALAAECLNEVRNRQSINATDRTVRLRIRDEGTRFDPPYYYEEWVEDDEVELTRMRFVTLSASVWPDSETRRWLRHAAQASRDRIVRQAALQELARGWKDDPETLALLKDRACSDEHFEVRLATLQELARGWKEDPETLVLLKDRVRSDEKDVRLTALEELVAGWKEDPDTIMLLKERVHCDENEDVRQVALHELARGWKDEPATLVLLKELVHCDEKYVVRMAALQELARGWKDDPAMLVLLKDLVDSDVNGGVRQTALHELAQGWKEDPETLALLKDRVRSDDEDLRQAALQELAQGWKEDPETLALLKDRLRSDEDGGVRKAALEELAQGWNEDPETLALLKDRVRSDVDEGVRRAALEELAQGWKEDPDTPALLKDRALSDEDYAVRIAALGELARGWKDDPESFALLKDRVRSDEHNFVRQVALQGLVRGWKEDPRMPPLLKNWVRSGEHSFVRQIALEELARGWKEDPETLALLKDRARSDDDESLRKAALHELARGWNEDPEILALLKDRVRSDEDERVRKAALEELAQGWKEDPDTPALLS